jgi:hypothetical protein
LDLYKASLLKQQSADRNGSPKDLHPNKLSWFQANQYSINHNTSNFTDTSYTPKTLYKTVTETDELSPD